MRTSFVRYVSPTPRHTSFRKERAIVGAARGRSASAIPDLELIHPGVSDLNRETPFGNSTRILSVVVAHLHCAVGRTVLWTSETPGEYGSLAFAVTSTVVAQTSSLRLTPSLGSIPRLSPKSL